MAFVPSSSLGEVFGRQVSARFQAHNGDAAQDVLASSLPPLLPSPFSHQFVTLADDLSDALTAPSPYQTFEPQVNVPALSAFAFVTVVFGLLQLRINRVQTAAQRRTAALESLREAKSLQLSADDFAVAAAVDDDADADGSGGGGAGDDGPPPGRRSRGIAEASVRAALDEYEAALREELSLRRIVPGVRIVAPGDPRSAEADLAAARQFLGLEINDAGEAVPIGEGIEKNTSVQPSTGSAIGSVGNEGDGEGMSTGSKAVLLAVAMLQLGLLYLLSFDPMASTDVVFN